MPRACAASTNDLRASGAAIGGVRRVRQHTIVAPAARAAELRHRHQLDGRDAQRLQVIQLLLHAGEGAGRRERAGMQLVDHGLLPRAAAPIGRAPGVGARIDQSRRPVYVADLRPRRRVGHGTAADIERIAAVDVDRVGFQLEPAIVGAQHGKRSSVGGNERHAFLGRRPKTKARAAVEHGCAPRGRVGERRHRRAPS